MPVYAFLLILISSSVLGIISIFRKEYQIINGASMTATLFFTLFISAIGALLGILINKGLNPDMTSMGFACIYSIISTATASICIYATAFGNVSALLLWAMLGSLLLPTVFGLISQPEENSLTVYKAFGLLMALVCIAVNFIADKRKSKGSLKFKILCAAVFFTNGSALIIFNLKNRLCTNVTNMDFIAQYMLFSVVAASLCLLLMNIAGGHVTKDIKSALNKKSIIIMAAYAVLFFVSEILALKCTGLIPLIIQAPVTFSIPIIVTAVIDYAVYKVKPEKGNIIQMIFAFLCCISFIIE